MHVRARGCSVLTWCSVLIQNLWKKSIYPGSFAIQEWNIDNHSSIGPSNSIHSTLMPSDLCELLIKIFDTQFRSGTCTNYLFSTRNSFLFLWPSSSGSQHGRRDEHALLCTHYLIYYIPVKRHIFFKWMTENVIVPLGIDGIAIFI